MADETPNDSAAEENLEPTPETPAEETSAEVPPTEDAPAEVTAEVVETPAEAVEASPDVAELPADETTPIPEPTASDLTLARIYEEADKVTAALRDWQIAESQAKAAKEQVKEAESAWKAAVARQQAIIKGSKEEMPLFDRVYYEARTQIAGTAATIEAEKNAPPDESWRTVRLDTLGIPSSTVALLGESDIFTIGDISNLQLKRLSLTDVRGIGQAKATRIEEALADFWAKNPQYTRAAPPAPEKKTRKKAEPEPDDEPRVDREPAFEPPADTFDPPAEEYAPEADELDLEDDASEEE